MPPKTEVRTLTLQEYSTLRQVPLSQAEVRLLAGTPAVSLAPRGDGRYDLTASSTVGTIVLPTLRVLIRPKVALPNLFFLLAYGAGLTRWTRLPFPYEKEADFFQTIAWAFAAEVSFALQCGLVRGYQACEEPLPTLRGRIDLPRQIAGRPGQSFPLHCRFDEFTEDVTLNRVLRAAHDRLLYLPHLDPDPARRLWATRRAFLDVESPAYTPATVPALTFNRLNNHWSAAGALAQLILRQHTLRDQTGAIAAASFTVDMNRLFERFLQRVFADETHAGGFECVPQASRKLTDDVPMRPDFLLRRHNRDVAVADAKYKVPDDHWFQDDLYQLLAYCAALDLPSGLLVYGGPRPLEGQVVRPLGVTLEVSGIDLSLRPNQILAQARAIAHHFISRARDWSR